MVLTPDEAKKKAKEERERKRNPVERLEMMIDDELVRNNGTGIFLYEIRHNFAKHVMEEAAQDYRNAGWKYVWFAKPQGFDVPIDIEWYCTIKRRK